MSIFATKINGLTSGDDVLDALSGKVVLIVNVASRCGLTPQYEGLEAMQRELSPLGFSVLGVPCNQFGAQEPGSPEEITTFCSTSYGVTFPLTEKIDVNGENRHPLYDQLVTTADAEGHTGDIRWNFEKFLIDKSGNVIGRFGPMTAPEDPALRSAVQAALA